jgi:flagellar protein FlbD
MIVLHRLRHPIESLYLNHDMIVSVEATPDTVICLTTGDKFVVAESPDKVAELVRDCRVEIAAGAMDRRSIEMGPAALTASRRRFTALDLPALEPVG